LALVTAYDCPASRSSLQPRPERPQISQKLVLFDLASGLFGQTRTSDKYLKLKDLYSLGYAPDASARELLKLGLGSVNVVTKDGSKSSNFRVLGRGEDSDRKPTVSDTG
jgi:hypothetical protein